MSESMSQFILETSNPKDKRIIFNFYFDGVMSIVAFPSNKFCQIILPTLYYHLSNFEKSHFIRYYLVFERNLFMSSSIVQVPSSVTSEDSNQLESQLNSSASYFRSRMFLNRSDESCFSVGTPFILSLTTFILSTGVIFSSTEGSSP